MFVRAFVYSFIQQIFILYVQAVLLLEIRVVSESYKACVFRKLNILVVEEIH